MPRRRATSTLPVPVAVVIALASPPSLAHEVRVEALAGCIDAAAVERQLRVVLSERSDGPGDFTVVEQPSERGVIGTLRAVTAAGAIVLERELRLAPGDCASAPGAFAAVLVGFLDTFPAERWRDLPQTAPPPLVTSTRDAASTLALVWLGVGAQGPSAGADAQLGAAIDMGTARHRLTVSSVARLSGPAELGPGRYIDGRLLLGAGWRYAEAASMLRVEVLTGALYARGVGFSRNFGRWVPWLEAQATWLWSGEHVAVGPQLSVSPLHHRVRADGVHVRDLGWLRAGVIVAVPFWDAKL